MAESFVVMHCHVQHRHGGGYKHIGEGQRNLPHAQSVHKVFASIEVWQLIFFANKHVNRV